MAWRPTLRRGNALDGHRVVVLEEHDANLRQPPPRQLNVLLRDVGSQGHRDDGEDAAWSLPHRPTGGDVRTGPSGPGFSLRALGQPFRCDCVDS